VQYNTTKSKRTDLDEKVVKHLTFAHEQQHTNNKINDDTQVRITSQAIHTYDLPTHTPPSCHRDSLYDDGISVNYG